VLTATIGSSSRTTGTSGSSSASGSGSSRSNGSSGSNTSNPNGLPQGALIAIAVLATITGLMALFIGWYILYYRRRKQQRASLPRPYFVPPVSTPQSLPGQQPAMTPSLYVIPHLQTHELHGQAAPIISAQESGADQRIVELAVQDNK
jgi:hypothetical protein